MRELALYFNDLRAEDMSELSMLKACHGVKSIEGAWAKVAHSYELALKAQPLTDGESIDAEELEYRREALRGMADVT